MGKSRSSRKKKRRGKNGGVGTPSGNSKGGAAKQARAARATQTITLLQSLASANADVRLEACSAIANMFQGPDTYKEDVLETLIRNSVFRKLNSRITDTDKHVRRMACGALNNIGSSCGLGVRKIMNDSDVTTTIFSLLKRQHEKEDEEMILHAFQLLCNIFENSDRIEDLELDENLNSVLLKLEVKADTDDNSDILAAKTLRSNNAARLLHIGTDQNIVLARKFESNNNVLQRLVNMVSSHDQDIITRLHICGTLYNISLTLNSKLNIISVILQVIGSKEVLHEACDYLKNIPETVADENGMYSESLLRWRKGMDAQILALELLANVCCVDVPEDVELDEIKYRKYAQEHEKLVQVMIDSGAMARIVSIFLSIGEILQTVDPGHHTRESVLTMGQRASGCLDNFIQNMSLQSFKSMDKKTIWDIVYKVMTLVKARADEEEIEFLESLTALSWSFYRRMKENKSDKNCLIEIPQSQIIVLMELATSPTSPFVRSNSLGILGELYEIGLNNIFLPVVSTIANCLNDNSISVVVQSLFVIFTIFGDETNNDVFIRLKLLDVLRTLVPRLRSRAQDNNNARLLRMDAKDLDDAIANLRAFIEYKEREMKT